MPDGERNWPRASFPQPRLWDGRSTRCSSCDASAASLHAVQTAAALKPPRKPSCAIMDASTSWWTSTSSTSAPSPSSSCGSSSAGINPGVCHAEKLRRMVMRGGRPTRRAPGTVLISYSSRRATLLAFVTSSLLSPLGTRPHRLVATKPTARKRDRHVVRRRGCVDQVALRMHRPDTHIPSLQCSFPRFCRTRWMTRANAARDDICGPLSRAVRTQTWPLRRTAIGQTITARRRAAIRPNGRPIGAKRKSLRRRARVWSTTSRTGDGSCISMHG